MAVKMFSRSNFIIRNFPTRISSNILSHYQNSRQFSDELVPKKPNLDFVDDKLTHTGQIFGKEDRRVARFVGKEKQINPRFAIDLIAEIPPKACKERVVSCDGGGGPLGHPVVFINLDDPGNHSCGYCGLRFYKEDGHGH